MQRLRALLQAERHQQTKREAKERQSGELFMLVLIAKMHQNYGLGNPQTPNQSIGVYSVHNCHLMQLQQKHLN